MADFIKQWKSAADKAAYRKTSDSVPAAHGVNDPNASHYLKTETYTQSEVTSLIAGKQDFISPGTTLQYYRGDKTWAALNTSVVPEGTNLYFTNTRARNAISSADPINYDASTGVIDFNFSSSNLQISIKDTGELDTIQDIHSGASPSFMQILLGTQATSSTQAVRADRTLQFNTSAPLTGGGSAVNLTANRAWTFGISHNATNLKLTSNALNTIQDIALTSSPQFLNLTLSGVLTQQGTGINSFAGDFSLTGNKSIYNNFTSGWLGSGYRLDYGVTTSSNSTLEVDNLWVRGTMNVYELIINQVRATNGSLFVTSSAKVDYMIVYTQYNEVVDLEDPAGHNLAPFLINDIVMCQRVKLDNSAVIKRIVRRVSAVSGRRVTFAALTGATDTGGPITVNDEFVRIGNTTNTSRQGVLYLTSDDSNAPYMDIADGITSWADWGSSTKLKARIGRLTGITDSFFGTLTGYGLYAKDNIYLKGKIYAEDGGWIAGWSIRSIDIKSPSVVVGGLNNEFKLNASSASGLIGAHLYTDTSAVGIPGFLSFGRILSGYGAVENKLGISYKHGNKTYFELTNTDKNIAGWNFDETKLFKDTVSIESSAAMKGLVVDTDLLKVGKFTTATPSNTLSNITSTVQNGYTYMHPSDIYWIVQGGYWDTNNVYGGAVLIKSTDYFMMDSWRMPVSSWDARMMRKLFAHDTKLMGRRVRFEFKATFSIYDYYDAGGTFKVRLKWFKADWNILNLENIIELTVPTSLQNTVFNYTGGNGLVVDIPYSVPDTAHLYIEFCYAGGSQLSTLYPKQMIIESFRVSGYEGVKTQINQDGLVVYNSPINYIQFNAAKTEVELGSVKINNKRPNLCHGRLAAAPVKGIEIGDTYISTSNNYVYMAVNLYDGAGTVLWKRINYN